MSVQTKQILSVFLAASLAWIFVGCILFCGDASKCAGEFSTENYSAIENQESSDSCPLGESVSTITPERISLYIHFTGNDTKTRRTFPAIPIFSFVLKNYAEFYRPPENLPPQIRPRVLRI